MPEIFDFRVYSLPVNLALFAAAGAAVWFAGTRLSRYVSEISDRTGAGRAFLGALLLGGITSLPEVATTVTASVAGDPLLAVNNIFGSIAMNLLLLAVVADVVDGGEALTALVRESTLILQGALSMLVIAVAAGAVLAAEHAVFGIGAGSLVLFLVSLSAFYLTHRFQSVHRWRPAGEEGRSPQAAEPDDLDASLARLLERVRDRLGPSDTPAGAGPTRLRSLALRVAADLERARSHEALRRAEELRLRGGTSRATDSDRKTDDARAAVARLSNTRLSVQTAAASAGILVAGYFLSRTGSAVSTQTGLGSTIVGFVLVAFATSLPEISTLISSVRMGEFSLVFSEVFGTNIFNAGIIFLADLAYAGGPLLETAGQFSQAAALLGIVLTSVYVVGLVTRSSRTSIARLGKDSLAVIALYAAGVAFLWTLQ